MNESLIIKNQSEQHQHISFHSFRILFIYRYRNHFSNVSNANLWDASKIEIPIRIATSKRDLRMRTKWDYILFISYDVIMNNEWWIL